MDKLDLLGKNCRDIVTGFEGICTGVVEWMYGCTQFMLTPKSENNNKKSYPSLFLGKQLEILDDGIREKVEIPEYHEPVHFGKECRDKVTGIVGMCTGRVIWLFNCDQYILEIKPEDSSKESRTEWLDDGRIEETHKKEVEPEEVAGTRHGGVLDALERPEKSDDIREAYAESLMIAG